MPRITTRRLDTYYETDGDAGTPFVLVNGLGSSLDVWDLELREALAAHHRCIAFDNRGVGRSAKPEGPYSIADFAEDALALLDALELDRVHLLGASMGGLIAQEIALRAPDRLRSLTLCCTFPGFSHMTPPSAEVFQVLRDAGSMPPEQGIRHNWTICFLSEFLERETEWLERKLARELRYPCPPDSYDWHMGAAGTWDGAEGLRHMPVPTLVVTGEKDVLVPPENSHTLCELLPNATLKTYARAGHAVLTERLEDVAADILAHTAAHEEALA